jgi:hypothetical protein
MVSKYLPGAVSYTIESMPQLLQFAASSVKQSFVNAVEIQQLVRATCCWVHFKIESCSIPDERYLLLSPFHEGLVPGPR